MLVSGGLVPHPPVLIPEVSGGRSEETAKTARAMESLVERLSAENPDVLVMSGPHHPTARERAAGVITSPILLGDFARFGAPDVKIELEGLPEVSTAVIKEFSAGFDRGFGDECRVNDVYEVHGGTLDWDFTVFLSIAARMGFTPKVLPLIIAWGQTSDWHAFGDSLFRFLESRFTDLRFGYVASGDLSHSTRKGTSYEYHPYGPKFDSIVANAVSSGDKSAFLSLTGDDLAAARQCGAASFASAMGFYGDGRATPELLSYDDPFGVGYLVGYFKVV